MSRRFDELSARHRELLAHSAVQRQALAETSRHIENHLDRIDHRLELVRTFVRRPAVIGAAIAAVVLIGPRRLAGWVVQGAMLYTAARRLQPGTTTHQALDQRPSLIQAWAARLEGLKTGSKDGR
jgi:YqjK-like protein